MDFFEIMLQQKLAGGGGDIEVNSLSVTENGTYTALPGHAFSPINVSVPVGVFPSGTSDITSNGIYSVVDFASVNVSVPGIIPSGTSSITANGIYNITSFVSVDVNVSGGGGANISTLSAVPLSSARLIFSGLIAEPIWFIVNLANALSSIANNNRRVVGVNQITKQLYCVGTFSSRASYTYNPFTFFGADRISYIYESNMFTIDLLSAGATGPFTSRASDYYTLTYIY